MYHLELLSRIKLEILKENKKRECKICPHTSTSHNYTVMNNMELQHNMEGFQGPSFLVEDWGMDQVLQVFRPIRGLHLLWET